MTHRAGPGKRAFTPPGALRKLSPLTPLLEMWTAVAAIIALVFYNLIDLSTGVYRRMQAGQLGSQEILLVVGIVLVVFSAGLAINYLAWRAMGFRLTDDAIIVHSGVIFRTKHHVRLDRVQTVDVVQPLIARPFRLGEIAIEAAGGADSKASIRFVPMKDIELDRAEILEAVRKRDHRDAQSSGADLVARAMPEAAPTKTRDVTSPSARQLYGPLSTGRILGSIFLGHGLGAIAFAALMLVLSIAVGASLLGAVAAVVAVFQAIWTQVNRGWHARASVEDGHLNLSYGLTEERKQSVPVDRIHAVEVRQPFLWRLLGWWQVRANIAGYGQSSKMISSSTTLLPAGSEAQMRAVVGAVQPPAVWQRMFQYEEPDWMGSPKRARVVSCFDANWQACRLDADGVSVRTGWLNKRWRFVPYSHVQGFTPKQGPVEQLLAVASIQIDLVPGPVQCVIEQQEVARATQMTHWLHAHCVKSLG